MFWLFSLQFIIIPVAASVADMQKNDTFYLTKVFLDTIHMADIIKLFFTGYYDQDKSKVVHNRGSVAKYAKNIFFVLYEIQVVSNNKTRKPDNRKFKNN